MINLSSDIINSINTSVSSAVQELLPILAILISVPLAFFVIRKILFTVSLAKR